MEWKDVTNEMVVDELQLASVSNAVVYSHKFGPVVSLADGRRIGCMSGLQSGNYKVELEFVEGAGEMTIKAFIREPAEVFKKGK